MVKNLGRLILARVDVEPLRSAHPRGDSLQKGRTKFPSCQCIACASKYECTNANVYTNIMGRTIFAVGGPVKFLAECETLSAFVDSNQQLLTQHLVRGVLGKVDLIKAWRTR